MAKALSVDLRRRVVDAVDAGGSCRSAAARFGVSGLVGDPMGGARPGARRSRAGQARRATRARTGSTRTAS